MFQLFNFMFPLFNFMFPLFNFMFPLFNFMFPLFNFMFPLFNFMFPLFNLMYPLFNFMFPLFNFMFPLFNFMLEQNVMDTTWYYTTGKYLLGSVLSVLFLLIIVGIIIFPLCKDIFAPCFVTSTWDKRKEIVRSLRRASTHILSTVQGRHHRPRRYQCSKEVCFCSFYSIICLSFSFSISLSLSLSLSFIISSPAFC